MRLTIDATLHFVQNNEGKWPESWDDLQNSSEADLLSMASGHVEFDFDADPKVLATQQLDTFTGFYPHQPCNDKHQEQLERLIQLLRTFHPPDDE